MPDESNDVDENPLTASGEMDLLATVLNDNIDVNSEEFQNLREAHIKREVKGTLCDGCIRQADTPYRPINTHLT